MIKLHDWPKKGVVKKQSVKQWIESLAQEHQVTLSQLSYTFVSDDEILRINQDYLKHDYYTDVITFDYSESEGIKGEVYISLDTVRSNAQLLNQDFDKELYRVVAHALLHLIGFNDKTEVEKEQMRSEEDKCLILLSNFLKNN